MNHQRSLVDCRFQFRLPLFAFLFGLSLLLLLLLPACANLGSPNGGPYDEKPPVFLGSTPEQHQTRVKTQDIVLYFDELVQIEKPSENVIITPPQREMPVIRTAGKKVVIELKDSLLPNATYTIDFTNSLADNNEKNILENFVLAFSTGDVIDSLEVAGTLLNAENLEPMPGMTIGLHRNVADSAFRRVVFERTSRTNDRGHFTLRNIAAGTYRLFALNDVNRDYKFDQPGEDIAFLDSLVVPTFEFATRQDTLWKDSLTVDTVKTVDYTHFLPDNLVLMLFKERFARQYLKKAERSSERMFSLNFADKVDTIPMPRPLNFAPKDSAWYYVQKADGGATVHYWLTDTLLLARDTLQMAVDYPKSDSLNILRKQTDTLSLVLRKRPKPKKSKRKKGDAPEPIPMLGVQLSPSGAMNVFDTLRLTFDAPLTTLTKEQLRLSVKVDTLWEECDFRLVKDSLNSLSYCIERKWMYEESFQLEIDSASVFSVYGLHNDDLKQTFTTAKEDEYGHLFLNILRRDTLPCFVELLNASDAPVRKAPVKDGGVLFMNLKPDKYYARLIRDANENGLWDTGEYATLRQPEGVSYYPKMMEIRKNWQLEESWDIDALPLAKQKPLEVTKNKPKEVVKKKRNYKDEGKRSSSNSGSMGGMGGMGGMF